MARTLGQRGYRIADTGSDTLVAALRAGTISEPAVEAIAANAPNNDRLHYKVFLDGSSIKVTADGTAILREP